MSTLVTAASVIAEEAAKQTESNWFPAWGFGVGAFIVFGILLWATSMINVDR